MTEINKKLLKLIMDNKNLNEISEALNLSPKQICRRLDSLKNSGYNIECTLLDSGTIEYAIAHEPVIQAVHSAHMKLVKEPYNLKAMVISDLHIGSKGDNLERVYSIYDYCIQHGINIIINVGDLIDGNKNCHTYIDLIKQPEYFIKNYPYDKNILNIVCFGNHDIKVLKNYGIDMSILLKNARPDFVPIGYGEGLISILNSYIVLNHPITTDFKSKIPKLRNTLLLKGHSHKMKVIKQDATCLKLNIPTLSDVIINDKPTLPGAMELEINFFKPKGDSIGGTIKTIHVDHLVITDKIYSVNKLDFSFAPSPMKKITEEDITKEKPRKLIR